MTDYINNIIHLPQYDILDTKVGEDDLHFQVEGSKPDACEVCGAEGELVRFGKSDVPYRDLPIHGKRVTL